MSDRDKNLPAHHVVKGDPQLNGPFLDDINAALDEQRRMNIAVSEVPDFDSLEELEEFKAYCAAVAAEQGEETDLVLLTESEPAPVTEATEVEAKQGLLSGIFGSKE